MAQIALNIPDSQLLSALDTLIKSNLQPTKPTKIKKPASKSKKEATLAFKKAFNKLPKHKNIQKKNSKNYGKKSRRMYKNLLDT